MQRGGVTEERKGERGGVHGAALPPPRPCPERPPPALGTSPSSPLFSAQDRGCTCQAVGTAHLGRAPGKGWHAEVGTNAGESKDPRMPLPTCALAQSAPRLPSLSPDLPPCAIPSPGPQPPLKLPSWRLILLSVPGALTLLIFLIPFSPGQSAGWWLDWCGWFPASPKVKR